MGVYHTVHNPYPWVCTNFVNFCLASKEMYLIIGKTVVSKSTRTVLSTALGEKHWRDRPSMAAKSHSDDHLAQFRIHD